MAHEIGARFELVNEKLDNAQQVAEEIRSLITLLGDLRAPIFEEFRERRIEHAELQALLSTAETMRQRLEALERDNVELNARAAGAEAALADTESRYNGRRHHAAQPRSGDRAAEDRTRRAPGPGGRARRGA